MAGLDLFVTSGNVTLVANTAKTILQAKAPANQGLLIKGIRYTGGQPAGGVDPTIRLRLTWSTANFGTLSAATKGPVNRARSETPQGTYGSNASVEPTTPTDSGLLWNVQPQSGIEEFLPLDQWIPVIGGQAANLEALSVTGTPIIAATLVIEE